MTLSFERTIPRIRKSSYTRNKTFEGEHRFEHWYIDNQIYFITARCRNRFPAFESEKAKAIFWDRLGYHAHEVGFVLIIATLIDNHYHLLGYLKVGTNLESMMRKLHGSVAKLVNDLLPERHLPFWHDRKHLDYFDGCLRDVKQFRLTFRYTQNQSVRHGICRDSRDYPHAKVFVELDRAMNRATELKAPLYGVTYKRYAGRDEQGQ